MYEKLLFKKHFRFADLPKYRVKISTEIGNPRTFGTQVDLLVE